MARRSLWCSLAVPLALLLVTTHGLQGSTSQVEGHDARTTLRSRGGSRFNLKPIEGLEASPAPFTSSSPSPNRSRNNRRGGSRTEDATRPERAETTTLKSRRDHDRDIKLTAAYGRKSSESPASHSNLDRRRVSPAFAVRKSSTESPERATTVISATEATKEIKNDRRSGSVAPQENDEPRRIGLFRTRNGGGFRRGSSSTPTTTEEIAIPHTEKLTDNQQFDTTGPSVFSGTTEISRSRTGRKIQTTLSSRDLKVGFRSSGRYTSLKKNSEKTSGQTAERRSDDFSAKRRHDIVPSGSESIGIDIPLTGDLTARSRSHKTLPTLIPGAAETTTEFSSQRNASPEGDKRGRSGGRSNGDKNSETASSTRFQSRRGSSRFSEIAPVDNSLEKNSRSRTEAVRSRNAETKTRNSERSEGTSRARGRSQQMATNQSSNTSTRSSPLERNSNRNENSIRRDRPSGTKPVTLDNKSSSSEGRGRTRVKSRVIGNSIAPPTATVTPVQPIAPSTTAKSTTGSTQAPVTSMSTSTARISRVQNRADTSTEGRESGNRGRTTTVPSAGRKALKEDFFNYGLGFRGRKMATEAPPAAATQPAGAQSDPITEAPSRGNPGWTLKRRPSYHQEETMTTYSPSSATTESTAVTISNEIPTSNQVPQTLTSSVTDKKDRGTKRPFRPINDIDKAARGSKNFKKTSGQSKVNVDFEESDNYPPEFKAKLAQSENGQEATPRPDLRALMEKIPIRHTRSPSVPSEPEASSEDHGVTSSERPISMLVSVIPVSTTPLSAPSITDASNGLFKKRPTTHPQFVARSRQKLESARNVILRPEPNNDQNNVSSEDEKRTSSTTSSPVVTRKTPEAARRPTKAATTTKNSEERKTSNFVKRFGATKNNPRAEKSLQASTTRRTENKFDRISKVRKTEEKTETITLDEIDEENSLIESTTLPYSTEESTVQKTQPTKPWILSRRVKEIPREAVSTTTRRSRAWNTQHIDKNFQEPTSRSNKSGESSTRRFIDSATTTRKSRAWNTAHIDRNWQEPITKSVTTEASSSTTKKSRVWNTAYIDRNWQEPTPKSVTNDVSSTTESSSVASRARSNAQVTEVSSATTEKTLDTGSAGSRYTRKKTEVFKPFEAVPKSGTTEQPVQSVRRREFRPRTATYRRHSEPPAVMVVNALSAEKSSSTSNSIAITPKAPTRFHATVRGSGENSSQRSARQEPALNVRISNENGNVNTIGGAPGIVGTSNGVSGNSDSNIFSPTRSTLLLNSNATLLEQLRSTVAPFLNALGNRTPIFATAYRDIANSSNSGARVTPSGSPPRFSARYKGAELFVRRPNVLDPAGPFLTSSIKPFTPTEDSGSAPPISVESPGEPKVITFYQALESASIINELGQTDLQQQQIGSNAQVDAQNATDSDSNGTNNANNDTVTTTTIPTTPWPVNETIVESITTDVSSITTIETSQASDTSTQQDNTTLTPRIATILPETADTTASVEANPATTLNSVSGNETSSNESTLIADKALGTTPEATPPSTQLDTTTIMSTVPEAITTLSATTEMSTETLTTQEDTSPQSDASLQVTTVPSLVGRILYLETEENSTTTTEIVDTTTPGSTTATGMIQETSMATNMVDTSSTTDEAILEMNMVTMVQPNSEVPTTTIVSTTESVTVQSEGQDITTQVTSVSETTSSETKTNPDINSNLEVVVQTATSAPETTTSAQVTPVPETMRPETTTASSSTLEVAIETATSAPETTTAAQVTSVSEIRIPETTFETTTATQMTETSTILDSTPPVTTELLASSFNSSESPSGISATMISETTTSETLEIQARFQDPTTNAQVTEDKLEVTTTPAVTMSTDSGVTDISTRSTTPLESTESPTLSQSMLDMIRARTGNEMNIPSLSDDSLMSRMMMRLMMTLFSDSSEATGSSSNVQNPTANETTTQSIEQPNTTEATSSTSVDELPQLLGGFLDNTDENVEISSSLKNQTFETSETIESNPVVEIQFSQPVETTPMILEQTTSKPEATTTQVTTTPTPPITSTSSLEETTLTPSGTTEMEDEQTETSSGPREDLASTPATDDTNVTTNQPSETTLTPPGTVELLETRVASDLDQTNQVPIRDLGINNVTPTGDIGVTTNTNVLEITTTSIPKSSPTPSNENPNSLAGFQDTTTATAQRTAGDDAQATSQPDHTTISDSTTPPSPATIIPTTTRTTFTTTTSVPTTIPTTATESSTTVPSTTAQSSTSSSTSSTEMLETNSVAQSQQTTTSESPTVSMESTIPTISQPVDATSTSEAMTSVSVDTIMASDNTSTESPVMTTEATTMMMNDTNTTVETPFITSPAPIMTSMSTTTQSPATTQYLGRFGGSRITPAPRFSVSSSTKTPLRDYLVYGIFPNKTIVRKRPEDNLIDARNVDSPYVIFGIFPDGKLVRKFPNGTVIPDPPTNPVEVVFSLSTTTTSTTNRPRPVFIDNQQANQGYYYNQNAALYNNRPSSIIASMGGQPGGFPSQVNLGLSGNAIGPNGEAPANQPTGTKMSDLLLNTQMGTASNAVSEIGGLLTTTLNSVSTAPPMIVTPSNVNPQGGRFIQDRERDEASRSREAGGQRSTVYIGQEKFINYWSDGNTANNNSRLVSVKINSVASSVNEGPASSSGSQPASFNILPNNQSGGGQVTAPPGFPWKDPLDQIFGITTQSPIMTASVASNTLEDTSPSRSPIMFPPINPLVEVFSPLSATVGSATSNTSASTRAPDQTTTATTTTVAPTTTTTTSAPTTTTTTTTAAPTTTTTTSTAAPTTTTTTTTTTRASTTTSSTTSTTTVAPTTMDVPRQTAFGTTFDDLAFLNSLLQTPSSGGATPKTLTEVEQLLANKILSLAIGNPGPTRSPKAIQSANASPNSLFSNLSPGPSSRPIIIDLLQTTSTTVRSIPTSANTVQATWRPISIVTPTVNTVKPSEPSTTTTVAAVRTTEPPQTTRKPQTTTGASFVITARPVTASRPRQTTTQTPPQGFGAGILQALFGGNFFGTPTTTQKPVQLTWRPVQTTRKPVKTTLAPIRSTPVQLPAVEEVHVTPRNVETSKIQSNTPNSLGSENKPVVTTSTARASTYSNEDDAKFLAALLKAAEQGGAKRGGITGASNSQGLSVDDEAFLRTILNGQASVQPAAGSSSGTSDAALLAALLKAQGIEPSTPPNRLREQLQSLDGNEIQPTRLTTTTRPITVPVPTKKLVPARPRAPQTTWLPSSTYPPPLFSNFANFGSAPERPKGEVEAPAGDGNVRSQVFTAAIGATRAFSQFLGAAITGAAQQLQSFVRNGTRYVSEVVG